MQSEIGSWRRRESSGRFAGARLRKERICPILSTHIEEGARAESWGFVNAAPLIAGDWNWPCTSDAPNYRNLERRFFNLKLATVESALIN